MQVIDQITRVPSWYSKKAEDERMKREADSAFRFHNVTDRLVKIVRFWQGTTAVLALALLFVLIAWVS